MFNTIIIGGGASGLMCASRLKGKTLIIEKELEIGRKILISGGGKCNFSNENVGVLHYYTSTPEYLDFILSNYSVNDAKNLCNKYKVKFEKREGGKLFAFSSKDILNILQSECEKARVQFALGVNVKDIKVEDGLFIIYTDKQTFKSKNLIIATGGKSYPHIGASDFALSFAKSLKFKLVQNQPALVGLKYPSSMKTFTSLSGISLPVRIKIKDKIFKENLLFAHIGITGPAVLNASLYTDVGNTLEIDFIPNRDLKKLPKRVYTFFQNYFNTTQKDQLLKYLSEFKFDYSGSFGYQKAEVMRGGIWLGYLNKYLESSKYPNLYFIGECLDITGELGGYNLHFAFASAITASLSINKKA